MMVRSYLPAQPGDKVLVGLAAGCVGQYGVFVLLALRHVKYCYFVSLSAGGEGNHTTLTLGTVILLPIPVSGSHKLGCEMHTKKLIRKIKKKELKLSTHAHHCLESRFFSSLSNFSFFLSRWKLLLQHTRTKNPIKHNSIRRIFLPLI